MNEYDSNRLSDLVKKVGYQRTKDLENIDCYILNTCHIREKATEKVYHDIGRLKKFIEIKKNLQFLLQVVLLKPKTRKCSTGNLT